MRPMQAVEPRAQIHACPCSHTPVHRLTCRPISPYSLRSWSAAALGAAAAVGVLLPGRSAMNSSIGNLCTARPRDKPSKTHLGAASKASGRCALNPFPGARICEAIAWIQRAAGTIQRAAAHQVGPQEVVDYGGAGKQRGNCDDVALGYIAETHRVPSRPGSWPAGECRDVTVQHVWPGRIHRRRRGVCGRRPAGECPVWGVHDVLL